MPLEYPQQLSKAYFSRLQLRLEFVEEIDLCLATLLQLRRELRQAAALLRLSGDDELAAEAGALLSPPAHSDPVARRRYRLPAPPFVFRPPPRFSVRCQPGDEIVLPLILWGRGRQQAATLLSVLELVGENGLHNGQGRFILQGVDYVDDRNATSPLWVAGASSDVLSLPYSDAAAWLDRDSPGEALALEFITPSRLLSDNRPLFRPTPVQLFGAMLRRVTSMLYAWCGLELVENAAALMSRFETLEIRDWQLRWEDWRTLRSGNGGQSLGGLMGRIAIAGVDQAELGWILRLTELLNLGKGATYGAGAFRLS